MTKKLQIRNSTADFLTFASQNEANSIEVRFEDETLWLTQQLIAELFQTSIPCICTNKIRKKHQKKFPLYRRAQESFFVHWRIHPDNVYVDLRYNKYSCFLG